MLYSDCISQSGEMACTRKIGIVADQVHTLPGKYVFIHLAEAEI